MNNNEERSWSRIFLIIGIIIGLVAIIALALWGVSRFLHPTTATNNIAQPAADEAEAQEDDGVREILYFNDEVQRDDNPRNDYNFGPDRKAEADKAVAEGKASSVQEWVATNDGEGDFFRSISVDPARCAAIALHLDESLGLPETILVDEQDVPIDQRADQAHLHFRADGEYWDRALLLIKKYLTSGEIRIEHLMDYTSAMYMVSNGLEGDKPSVVVRNSTNTGGDMVVFAGEYGVVMFRLQCGYQAIIKIPYWTAPDDEPPVQDNPEPTTPTPTPTPETTPTPTPESKDRDAAPQVQGEGQPGYEDFGGPNHDNGGNGNGDTTAITEEAQSPETYTPTVPPQSDPAPAPAQVPAERPTTSDGQPDASAGTNTGSATADQDNGTTEQRGAVTYEVTVGNGENHGNINEIQAEHGSETVNPPVQDDGVNQGLPNADAVE